MTDTVTDPDAAGAHTVTLFPPPPARQRWAPGDLLRLLIGSMFVLIGLFAAGFAEGTISGVENDVVDAIGRIPESVEQAVLGTAQIMATFVPLLAIAVVVWRRRWMLLLMLWLSSAIASAAIFLLTAWLG